MPVENLSTSQTLVLPAAVDSRKTGLYYGWLMVLVAAVAMVATLPGRTHGLGMITERLLDDKSFDLSRTSYGVFNLWATLLGAPFCLACGRLIDRFGVRAVLTAVLMLLGLTVVGMTAAAGGLALFVLLTLTRGLGQSALSVVSLSIVGKWFSRRLSWAMACYTVLMSLGFIAAAMVGREYANSDWRIFWGALGTIVLLLGPLAWLMTRNSPEELGLQVDGMEDPRVNLEDDRPAVSFTLTDALRTPAFWMFGLATSLFGLVSSGISLFNESILVDRGFPKEVYYQSMAIGIFVGIPGNFLAGWLASRWSIARLTAVALAVLAGALAWLTILESPSDLVIYIVANALAGSVITVVFFSVWGKLYGRTHLGKIQGAAQMLTVFASALGPLLLGAGRDRFGSYSPVLWILAFATAVLAGIAWFTPLPRPQLATAGDFETNTTIETEGEPA